MWKFLPPHPLFSWSAQFFLFLKSVEWKPNEKKFSTSKSQYQKKPFLFLSFPFSFVSNCHCNYFFSPLNKYVCFYNFNLIMYPSPQKIWAKLFLMMLKVMILLSFLKRSMEMQSMFVATVNIPEAGVFPDTQERLSGS